MTEGSSSGLGHKGLGWMGLRPKPPRKKIAKFTLDDSQVQK
jgi:hypothetical protein